MTDKRFDRVHWLLSMITPSVLGVPLKLFALRDAIDPRPDARVYLQIEYQAPEPHGGGEVKSWRGRKWYLSEYMTDDEVVKTAYLAVRTAVEHEVMEGFLLDGQRVFNPHTPYHVLMDVAVVEVVREPMVKG